LRRTQLPGSGFLTPSWKQALLVGAGLVSLLVVFDIASPSNAIRVWYYMKVVAPPQETRYGFKSHLGTEGPYCLEVVSVVPGGVFDRAGVQPGYRPSIPSCFGIHVANSFYSMLEAARDTPLRIRFLPNGCRSEQAARAEPVWLVIVPPKPAV
jgi:hypothetical protein